MSLPSTPSDNNRILVTVDPDLEDLVPGFLDNRRRDVVLLETAWRNGDWPTVRLLGHRMKGDGGGYGFDAISAIGEALEQAARREDAFSMKEHIGRLMDFLSRVDVVYRR